MRRRIFNLGMARAALGHTPMALLATQGTRPGTRQPRIARRLAVFLGGLAQTDEAAALYQNCWQLADPITIGVRLAAHRRRATKQAEEAFRQAIALYEKQATKVQ